MKQSVFSFPDSPEVGPLYGDLGSAASTAASGRDVIDEGRLSGGVGVGTRLLSLRGAVSHADGAGDVLPTCSWKQREHDIKLFSVKFGYHFILNL